MTVVLIAVYVPIAFQSGLTGALFTEFALTLAGSVTISAVVALTLTPMLSSRFLKHVDREQPNWEGKLINFIDAVFDRLHRLYTRLLSASLDTLPVTLTFAVIILTSIYFLASGSKSELAPTEDQGVVLFTSTSAPNATIGQKAMWDSHLNAAVLGYPDVQHTFQIDVPGTDILGAVLKPWGERRPAAVLQTLMQNEAYKVDAGQQVAAFPLPPLPGSSGLPVQFVIKTTSSFQLLYPDAQKLLLAAQKSGKFIFLQSDLKIDQPQSTVLIDRDKAAALGLNMSQVGAVLSEALGGGYVNYFDLDGRSYKVIPQMQRTARLNVSDLENYYVISSNGIQRAALGHRDDSEQCHSGIDQPFPAAELRHDARRGRPRRGRGGGAGHAADAGEANSPARGHDRLRRADAPICANQQRLHLHLHLRADHHLPGACGAVQFVPRSAHHSRFGADVDRRGADLHLYRHRRA